MKDPCCRSSLLQWYIIPLGNGFLRRGGYLLQVHRTSFSGAAFTSPDRAGLAVPGVEGRTVLHFRPIVIDSSHYQSCPDQVYTASRGRPPPFYGYYNSGVLEKDPRRSQWDIFSTFAGKPKDTAGMRECYDRSYLPLTIQARRSDGVVSPSPKFPTTYATNLVGAGMIFKFNLNLDSLMRIESQDTTSKGPSEGYRIYPYANTTTPLPQPNTYVYLPCRIQEIQNEKFAITALDYWSTTTLTTYYGIGTVASRNLDLRPVGSILCLVGRETENFATDESIEMGLTVTAPFYFRTSEPGWSMQLSSSPLVHLIEFIDSNKNYDREILQGHRIRNFCRFPPRMPLPYTRRGPWLRGSDMSGLPLPAFTEHERSSKNFMSHSERVPQFI
ncbi:hypothetical protein BDN72DRAFT_856801 [Pluteus cervinus]|uniref:Uncharacterized protein n=1 Tax=Pluteus cervinus TaxID=181527 RepID=A0ACD3AX97_9AGAR|nr:hypothetical protein BDN72DRAFT_856801 [Pluteus cervinus]